jgi:hypothetical protein
MMERAGEGFVETDLKANGGAPSALNVWNAGLDTEVPPPREWLLGTEPGHFLFGDQNAARSWRAIARASSALRSGPRWRQLFATRSALAVSRRSTSLAARSPLKSVGATFVAASLSASLFLLGFFSAGATFVATSRRTVVSRTPSVLATCRLLTAGCAAGSEIRSDGTLSVVISARSGSTRTAPTRPRSSTRRRRRSAFRPT